MPLVGNVCRCCLADGCYKDISTEYYWSGQKEVYADMLLDTFNITKASSAVMTLQASWRDPNFPIKKISYTGRAGAGAGAGSGSRLICESCVAELRRAASFKRRVAQCERAVLRHLEHLEHLEHGAAAGEHPVEPKTEPPSYSYDSDCDLADLSPAHSSPSHVTRDGDDGDVGDVTKRESVSELELSDEIDDAALQGFDDDAELFLIKLLPNKKPAKRKISKQTCRGTSKTLKERNGVPKRKRLKKAKSSNPPTRPTGRNKLRRPLKTPLSELRMRENTVKLTLNSNMCLFKSLKIKYQCFYCKATYLHMQELKQHAATHTNETEKQKIVQRASFFKNAEISNLTCSLCNGSVSSIEELQEHLTTTHDFKFHTEGHLLVPFRLEENLLCVFCEANFKTFSRLMIHMNSHYTNHVCETCGTSFINKLSLRLHVRSLHMENKCPSCPATFTNSSQRAKHIVKQHDPSRQPRRYCQQCDKVFKYSYLLQEHRIREHGAQSQQVSCNMCDKTFMNPNNLKLHVRSVHLKERNHPCSECSMRFFTSTDRKRHERTHGSGAGHGTGQVLELFSCRVCDTKFKSKDSWRRHTKRQHGGGNL